MAKRTGKRSQVAARLADLIDDDERSPAAIAAAVNKSRTALYEWKSGRSEPDLETFAKLCTLLGASADVLLGTAVVGAAALMAPRSGRSWR